MILKIPDTNLKACTDSLFLVSLLKYENQLFIAFLLFFQI